MIKKTVRILWYIICTLGMCYYSQDVLSDYLKYKYTTTSYFLTMAYFPEVSLCCKGTLFDPCVEKLNVTTIINGQPEVDGQVRFFKWMQEYGTINCISLGTSKFITKNVFLTNMTVSDIFYYYIYSPRFVLVIAG